MVVAITNQFRSAITQYKTFINNEQDKEEDAIVHPLKMFVNEQDLLPLNHLSNIKDCVVCLGKINSKKIKLPGNDKPSVANIRTFVGNFFKRMFPKPDDRKGIENTISRKDTLFMVIGVKPARFKFTPLSCALFCTGSKNSGGFVYYIGTEQDKTFRQLSGRLETYVGYVIGCGLGRKIL